MLSVAFDASSLANAAAYRGVGTYARHLLDGLASQSGMTLAALAPQRVVLPAGVRRCTIHRAAPPRWRQAEHELRLPWDLHKCRADVLMSPSPDPPRRSSVPFVQTLHDVIPLVLDDPGLATERRRWSRYASRYRAAAAVIAVSRHAADEGIRLLDLDPARVHVSHHGVDPAYRPDGPAMPSEAPYLVAVGEYSARKGFDRAFAVIGALADAGYPHRLKVAGRIAPWWVAAVESERLNAPRPERIDLLGYVDDLAYVYRGADAFIGASRYEGFGLPALEAMASGTPVVAFANSATTEVVDGGGVLVEEGNVAGLIDALRRVLDDAAWRAEWRDRGLARAREFDWSRSVLEHAEVLRSVAGA